MQASAPSGGLAVQDQGYHHFSITAELAGYQVSQEWCCKKGRQAGSVSSTIVIENVANSTAAGLGSSYGECIDTIVASLSREYGRVRWYSGTPGVGVMARWHPHKDGTRATLLAVPMDSGASRGTSLLVAVTEQQGSADHCEVSPGYALLRSGRWRTDPSSWQGHAAVGLRFGMGVNDVEDLYRILESSYTSSVPLVTYSAEDAERRIVCYFLKGRLVVVRIALSHEPPLGFEASTREEWEAMAYSKVMRQRTALIETLTQKYGVPMTSPSPAELSVEREVESPYLSWTWQTRTAAIEVLHRARLFVHVDYTSLSDEDSLNDAHQAVAAADEARRLRDY